MRQLTADEQRAFLRLASALSPENLHWDGERSRADARRAERQLKTEWKALERKVGRRVTETEVWRTLVDASLQRGVR